MTELIDLLVEIRDLVSLRKRLAIGEARTDLRLENRLQALIDREVRGEEEERERIVEMVAAAPTPAPVIIPAPVIVQVPAPAIPTIPPIIYRTPEEIERVAQALKFPPATLTERYHRPPYPRLPWVFRPFDKFSDRNEVLWWVARLGTHTKGDIKRFVMAATGLDSLKVANAIHGAVSKRRKPQLLRQDPTKHTGKHAKDHGLLSLTTEGWKRVGNYARKGKKEDNV